ncbi:MAG: hypothetical protein AB4372_12225 [Xenococcus sp. (in: cyanobacteria)]
MNDELNELNKKLEKSRLNYARRVAKRKAIQSLYDQVRTGTLNEQSQRFWDTLTKHEQSVFEETKKLPRDTEFSHDWSTFVYQDLADDPASGCLARRLDHRYGAHGGDTKVPLNGNWRDPKWNDREELQIIDTASSEGEKEDFGMSKGERHLSMSNPEHPYEKQLEKKLASDIKRACPEFFKTLTVTAKGHLTNDSSIIEDAIENYGKFPGLYGLIKNGVR